MIRHILFIQSTKWRIQVMNIKMKKHMNTQQKQKVFMAAPPAQALDLPCVYLSPSPSKQSVMNWLKIWCNEYLLLDILGVMGIYFLLLYNSWDYSFKLICKVDKNYLVFVCTKMVYHILFHCLNKQLKHMTELCKCFIL